MPPYPRTEELLEPLLAAATRAGTRIMADWKSLQPVRAKADGSPTTDTDAAAEAIIIDAIRQICDLPIIAEEAHARGESPVITADEPFFLIDALDGTRDFIHGQPDFTVNIALIYARAPVFGIIHAPTTGATWHAAKGHGAHTVRRGVRTRLAMPRPLPQGYRILGGKRSSEPTIIEPFVGAHEVASRAQRSSSLKFCLLAEGEADLYPRLGDTYEWDIAAGDIILRESGGAILDLATGAPVLYGKHDRDYLNGGFIAGSLAAFESGVRTSIPEGL